MRLMRDNYSRLVKQEMVFPVTQKVHVSPIMVEQVVSEVMEEVRLLRTEVSSVDLVNGLLQLRVVFVVLAGNVATERRRPGKLAWFPF